MIHDCCINIGMELNVLLSISSELSVHRCKNSHTYENMRVRFPRVHFKPRKIHFSFIHTNILGLDYSTWPNWSHPPIHSFQNISPVITPWKHIDKKMKSFSICIGTTLVIGIPTTNCSEMFRFRLRHVLDFFIHFCDLIQLNHFIADYLRANNTNRVTYISFSRISILFTIFKY